MADADLISRLNGLFDEATRHVRAQAPGFGTDPVHVGLFDAGGRAIAMSTPVLIPSSAGTLDAVRSFFADEWQAGDAAVTNDPDAGAANACEMIVIVPIAAPAGPPAAFALARARVPDFGGWLIGGYSPQAVDRWAEGGRIEPAKIAGGGKYRREVVDIIRLNTRTPRLTVRRVEALVESARLLARSWRDEFGADALTALRAAETARIEQRLATLPASPLRVRQPIVLPMTNRVLGTIELSTRGTGGSLKIELTAPPVADLPINVGRYGVEDAVLAAVAGALELPGLRTDALARRISVAVGQPSLLAAPLPATVGCGRETAGQAVFRGVLEALASTGRRTDADRLWRDYQNSVLGDGFDPATGKLLAEREAAIRAREAKEPAA